MQNKCNSTTFVNILVNGVKFKVVTVEKSRRRSFKCKNH